VRDKCKLICPIGCIKEEYYLTNSLVSTHNENSNESVLNFFWDSKEIFILYEANMLLLDYFTYIGGLFGLWFGICLENLIDLMVKHTRIMRSKVKNKLKKFFSSTLTSINLFFIYLFHQVLNSMVIFIDFGFEKILSMRNKIGSFRLLFGTFIRFHCNSS